MQKTTVSSRNVVDLTAYLRQRNSGTAQTMKLTPRACRHCGALLADDESDDDCSSVFRSFETTGTRF